MACSPFLQASLECGFQFAERTVVCMSEARWFCSSEWHWKVWAIFSPICALWMQFRSHCAETTNIHLKKKLMIIGKSTPTSRYRYVYERKSTAVQTFFPLLIERSHRFGTWLVSGVVTCWCSWRVMHSECLLLAVKRKLRTAEHCAECLLPLQAGGRSAWGILHL